MTPKKAAAVIGCSPQQVRTLIRNGMLRARMIKTDCNPGYRYDVTSKEAQRYRDQPQGRGYPRGRKRSNPCTP